MLKDTYDKHATLNESSSKQVDEYIDYDIDPDEALNQYEDEQEQAMDIAWDIYNMVEGDKDLYLDIAKSEMSPELAEKFWNDIIEEEEYNMSMGIGKDDSLVESTSKRYEKSTLKESAVDYKGYAKKICEELTYDLDLADDESCTKASIRFENFVDALLREAMQYFPVDDYLPELWLYHHTNSKFTEGKKKVKNLYNIDGEKAMVIQQYGNNDMY